MICPKCLANNKNNAAVCQYCGQSLTEPDSDAAQPVIEEAGAAQPVIEVNGKARYAEDDAAADMEPGTEQADEQEQYTISITPLRERSSARRAPSAVYQGGPEEEEDFYASASIRPARTPMRTAVTVLLWVLIAAAVIFIGFMLYDRFWGDSGKNPPDLQNTMNSGGANITADDGSSLHLQAPTINFKQDDSGTDYYECIFYGRQGDSIYIAAKGQYYAFDQSGQYTVPIYLKDLVEPSVPLEDTYSSAIEFKYRQASGRETAFKLDNPLVFNIPVTQIKLIAPEADSQEIYEQNYSVIFRVDPGSTVIVNGVNISSSHVNSQGRVTYNLTLGPGSSEELNIEASAPYHKKQSKKITVTRAALNVNFTISANTPKSVKTDTVKITGVIDAGATLSCADYVLSELEINQLTGAYSVNVKLPGYGRHKILLTASGAEGQSSALSHTVLYLPDEDEYTRKVWVYDPKIVSNPSPFIGRSYLLDGVDVIEILDSPGTIFTVNMGTDDAPEYLAVEYYGSYNVKPGETYRIFGEVKGSYQGMTLIGGYFIYNP